MKDLCFSIWQDDQKPTTTRPAFLLPLFDRRSVMVRVEVDTGSDEMIILAHPPDNDDCSRFVDDYSLRLNRIKVPVPVRLGEQAVGV